MTAVLTYTSPGPLETFTSTANTSINDGKRAVAATETLQSARVALVHPNIWDGIDHQEYVCHGCLVE